MERSESKNSTADNVEKALDVPIKLTSNQLHHEEQKTFDIDITTLYRDAIVCPLCTGRYLKFNGEFCPR